jgi:hypothetical protein
MTAAVEIRGRAKMFGWETHVDEQRKEDTFIHGPHMVAVSYNRGWTVGEGKLFYFFRASDVQLRETTPLRNKKSAIVAWLARLGS